MATYYGDDNGNYGNYPTYHYSGGSQPYTSGALPYPSQPPYYPPPNSSTTNLRPDGLVEMRPSPQGLRHRSLPPSPTGRAGNYHHRRRELSPQGADDYYSYRHHNIDPVRRVQGAIKDTFSNSTSGVGVGVLGAIIGGLVARGANDATARSKSSSSYGNHHHRHHHRSSHQDNTERSRLVSTLVGAAVGGLGANALEKRIEVARERTAEKEEAWERKWGRDSRGRRTDRIEYDDSEDDDRGRRRSLRR